MSDKFIPIQALIDHLEGEDGHAYYGYWRIQYTPVLDLGKALYAGELIIQNLSYPQAYWRCDPVIRKYLGGHPDKVRQENLYPHKDQMLYVTTQGIRIDTKVGMPLDRVYRRETTTVTFSKRPMELVNGRLS